MSLRLKAPPIRTHPDDLRRERGVNPDLGKPSSEKIAAVVYRGK